MGSLNLASPDVQDNSFRMLLEAFIKNPPRNSVAWDVTPEMAETMLTHNTGNRPLSKGTVDAYAREMQDGRWQYTREPVIFADDGQLNDGQHRLAAIVKSGVAVKTDVSFGAPRGAFAVTDSGRRRTAGDIFAINGVPNYSSASAATLWLWKYHNTGMLTPARWVAPTSEELYEFYMAHQEIQKSLYPGQRFYKAKICQPSIMAALHFLCAQKNRKLADVFFEKIATGVGMTSDREPEYRLRKRLLDSAVGGARLDQLYAAAFTVMAWNRVRGFESKLIFRWRGEQNPNEPFPKVK